MSSEIEKCRVAVLVTPVIKFSIDKQCCTFVMTKTKKFDITTNTNGLSVFDSLTARVFISSISCAEYYNNHIYLHRAGSHTYIDLDFSLIHAILPEQAKNVCVSIKELRKQIDGNDLESGDNSIYNDNYTDYEDWDEFIDDIKYIYHGLKNE